MVEKYFENLSEKIKYITVDEDNSIELFGSLEGRVAGGPCPKIAWKRMWYGKHKVIQQVVNSNLQYKFVMNMRFDILKFETPEKITMLFDRLYKKEKPTNQIYFLNEEPYIGIDNCYFGGMRLMYILATDFHNNLDKIASEYPLNFYTEYLVFFRAMRMNLEMWNMLITKTHDIQNMHIL